jgi:uncharacterized protein (DUF983 family)
VLPLPSDVHPPVISFLTLTCVFSFSLTIYRQIASPPLVAHIIRSLPFFTVLCLFGAIDWIYGSVAAQHIYQFGLFLRRLFNLLSVVIGVESTTR